VPAGEQQLQAVRELLQLTDRETAAVSALQPGVGLWKVGQPRFIVGKPGPSGATSGVADVVLLVREPPASVGR
jgi:hypothetical protein